jgi:hypothetical protein
MVAVADIKKDLPNWPDEVIEIWLLPLANQQGMGWPPPNPFGASDWQWVLAEKNIGWWKKVDWKLEQKDCSFDKLAHATRRVVNEILQTYAFARKMSNEAAPEAFSRELRHVFDNGRFLRPVVVMSVVSGLSVIDGNNRIAALYCALSPPDEFFEKVDKQRPSAIQQAWHGVHQDGEMVDEWKVGISNSPSSSRGLFSYEFVKGIFKKRNSKKARAEHHVHFSIIGALASSASIISLIQHWLNIGLADVFLEMLLYYRKIAHLLLSPILAILPVHPPVWYQDAYILSLIFFTLFARTFLFIFKMEMFPYALTKAEALDFRAMFYVIFICGLVLSIFLAGLSIPIVMSFLLARGVRKSEGLYKFSEVSKRTHSTNLYMAIYFFFTIAIAFGCAAVFFGLNSLL